MAHAKVYRSLDEFREKFTPKSLMRDLLEEVCEKCGLHGEIAADKRNPRAGTINLEDTATYHFATKRAELERITRSFYEKRDFKVSSQTARQNGLKYLNVLKGREHYHILVSGGEERSDPSGTYKMGFPMCPDSRLFTIGVYAR